MGTLLVLLAGSQVPQLRNTAIADATALNSERAMLASVDIAFVAARDHLRAVTTATASATGATAAATATPTLAVAQHSTAADRTLRGPAAAREKSFDPPPHPPTPTPTSPPTPTPPPPGRRSNNTWPLAAARWRLQNFLRLRRSMRGMNQRGPNMREETRINAKQETDTQNANSTNRRENTKRHDVGGVAFAG